MGLDISDANGNTIWHSGYIGFNNFRRKVAALLHLSNFYDAVTSGSRNDTDDICDRIERVANKFTDLINEDSDELLKVTVYLENKKIPDEKYRHSWCVCVAMYSDKYRNDFLNETNAIYPIDIKIFIKYPAILDFLFHPDDNGLWNARQCGFIAIMLKDVFKNEEDIELYHGVTIDSSQSIVEALNIIMHPEIHNDKKRERDNSELGEREAKRIALKEKQRDVEKLNEFINDLEEIATSNSYALFR